MQEQASNPKPEGVQSFGSRALATLRRCVAVVSLGGWLTLCLVDLGLALLVTGSVVHQQALPLWVRAGAWFTSAALCALALLALGLVLGLLLITWDGAQLLLRGAWNHARRAVLARPSWVKGLRTAFPAGGLAEQLSGWVTAPLRGALTLLFSTPRWLRVAGLCALVVTLIAAHASGWLVMKQMGAFSGLEGLRFWWLSPGQTAQHVADFSPWLFLGAPLGVVVFGVALVLTLPALLARSSLRQRWFGALASLLGVTALALSSVFSFGASTTQRTDPDTHISYDEGDLFRAAVRYRSSPLTHVLFDVRALFEEESRGLPADPSALVETRKQLPLGAYAAQSAARPRHNVLFIVIESLRPDQLQALGGERPVLPHVDALASESLRFPRAYSSSTHSDLADPSILSSQYPARADGPYPDEPSYPRVLIYDVLRALGYRTAIISSQNEKWGNMIAFLDTGNLDLLLHSETYDGPTYVPRDNSLEDWLKGEKRAGKIDDRFTITEAIRWIGQGGQAPFVAYINLQNSHIPYTVPSDFPRRFSKQPPPTRYSMKEMTNEEALLARDAYADALHYVDAQLGRLFAHLAATDQWNDTLVIVTGDTGQAFKEHGFVGHSNLPYDEVVRVPIIMKVPGHAPRTDPRLAQHVDLPPTVLDALGLPPHPGFQGHSLLDESPRLREAFITVNNPFHRSIALIQGDYKLIYDQHLRRLLLFDLAADPGERHDISLSAASRRDRLALRLGTWYLQQRQYYFDTARQVHEYAPVLAPLPLTEEQRHSARAQPQPETHAVSGAN